MLLGPSIQASRGFVTVSVSNSPRSFSMPSLRTIRGYSLHSRMAAASTFQLDQRTTAAPKRSYFGGATKVGASSDWISTRPLPMRLNSAEADQEIDLKS